MRILNMGVANQDFLKFLFLPDGLYVVLPEICVRHLHLHVLIHVHHLIFVGVLNNR
jgi:hypothetical protein